MAQLRYLFKIMIVCFVMIPSSVFAKPSNEAVSGFVTSLSNQVIDILKNNENNLTGRQTGFEAVFEKAADVAKIAKFVAGGGWKNASTDARQAYVKVYHQYMAYTYASRITQYNNQKVMVGRVSDLGKNGFLVNTTLVTPDANNNMSIIWQLSAVDDVLKVTDLRVENISMALTQRAEFTAYLITNNNSLAELTRLLETRLNSLQ